MSYDEEVVWEALRNATPALLRRLPILTFPSALESERIISEEEKSVITVGGSSSPQQRKKLLDILMTKDGSTILKALEILKTREAGYTELVDRIFADMDALQKAKSVKPTMAATIQETSYTAVPTTAEREHSSEKLSSTSQSSQEVDAETLRSILGEFESRMGSKWSAIGIQLKEFDLVRHLRSSDETGAVCVQRILDAWFRSGNEKVPVCAATISKVLRSEAVKLSGVAAEFEKRVAEERKTAIKHAAPHPTSHPQHGPPNTGFQPPSGDPASNFDGNMALVGTPLRPPPNPPSFPQESPPKPPSVPQWTPANPSSVPSGTPPNPLRDPHKPPPQPSNSQGPLPSTPSSLVSPQQMEERRLESHPLDGDGRAGSDPMNRMPSIQEPEEHVRPAQGNVQRHTENADEQALKDLCWIPFDVKTVPIEAKGGILCLEPPSDELKGKEEGTVFVEIPSGAVSACDKVEMSYAIIPDGPFSLPVGYQLGSMVVYIHYDGRHVTKPLKLHLPHWYSGKDHVKDGLSFAIAPHSPTEGKKEYQFQLIEGGTFLDHKQYGICHIDGHSSLFAEVFKEKATSVHLATQWEHRLASEASTKIVITYFSEVWLKILAKYWQDWEMNQDTSVRFQFTKPWSWFSQVDQDAVTFHKRYTEEKLEGLVAHKLYPPAIHCSVVYSRPPDYEQPSVDILEVRMTGTNQPQVSFPIKVYNAIGGEEIIHDVSVASVKTVFKAAMSRMTDVIWNQCCSHPGNEVELEKSFGQRSVPFHEQPKIASAVCRTVWQSQIEGNSKFYGSGSFVSCVGKFYLLTCCHNFLSVKDGDMVSSLEDDYIKRKMKSRCKWAQYLCSTRV